MHRFTLSLLAATALTQPSGQVTFRASDGVTVYSDVYLPSAGQAAPLILLFHQGGGDARGEYRDVVPRLTAAGFAVLAVDSRGGGTRFQSENRTVTALGSRTVALCDAYADIDAALAFARRSGFTGPRILWGSSYTAALAVKAAAQHPSEVSAVLAFSPASGSPMAGCEPEPYVKELRAPVLLMRTRAEMALEWIARQMETWRAAGAEAYVVENGAHGSSMLVASRVTGSVEPAWEIVRRFLDDHRRMPASRSAGVTERRIAAGPELLQRVAP
jgi:dienelactone hydrolase